MIANIKHLGVNENGHRFYHVQTASGLQGILDLAAAFDREIDVLLVGTCYSRTYPATYLYSWGCPRIRDLDGGYSVIAAFLETWEHSTPEQREALIGYDVTKPINYWRTDKKTGKEKRTKNKVRTAELKPFVVPAQTHCQNGVWYRVLVSDLRRALKGITQAQAIRIGHVTVKRAILDALLRDTENASRKWILDQDPSKGPSALTYDPIVELRPVPDSATGALELRSADHKARVTVKHGAGDKYNGAHGWDRRIVFQSQAAAH